MSAKQRIVSSYLKKKADTDGSYMTVANLRGLHDHSAMLLEIVDSRTPLPDWVESKIDRAAASLLDVFEYMKHGDL